MPGDSVFDRFKGYGFIHHRALNAPAAFAEGLRLATVHPDRTHILEGDLCWDFSGANRLLYFRHPSYVVDTLAPAAVRDGLERRTIVGLDMLEAIKQTGACLVIELKVGRGDAEAALRHLIAHMEANFAGRYWIDGFSLTMLHFVKQTSPATPVTLHTECVSGGRALVGAPEWPPARIRRIDDLDFVDGIAIRRRGSEAFMARAAADVRSAGKTLIMSRLHTLRHFECSRDWGVRAGYMHWDFEDLIAFNDRLEGKPDIGARAQPSRAS
ncbi:MAG: hypothetical protein SFW09_10855 [Hyphomicrobiaceae bacterium]|nr:hypothetical protein [Hyphomicrobiaceae bacterium]